LSAASHSLSGDNCNVRTASELDDQPASVITDFLRYHVLIRVFDGNAFRWLHLLQQSGRADGEDARFLAWLHNRLSADPQLLDQIRQTVNASGLWPTGS
jgi:hypothetical protein